MIRFTVPMNMEHLTVTHGAFAFETSKTKDSDKVTRHNRAESSTFVWTAIVQQFCISVIKYYSAHWMPSQATTTECTSLLGVTTSQPWPYLQALGRKENGHVSPSLLHVFSASIEDLVATAKMSRKVFYLVQIDLLLQHSQEFGPLNKELVHFTY